jgi:hypothetical protein
MFPILVIAIGVAVLLFGKRLAVLGAAVGALLGIALLRLFSDTPDPLLVLAVPGMLAVIGFLVAGFAKGIVNIVLLVLGALAGVAIVFGFLDVFQVSYGWIDWLLALMGAGIGILLVMRFADLAMVVLAGLIGGLLVTRGLTTWLPILEGALGSLLVLVLAVAGIAYQGGLSGGKKHG